MELNNKQQKRVDNLSKMMEEGGSSVVREIFEIKEKVEDVDSKANEALKVAESKTEYVLTEHDKKEIASQIEVPIVEKVIEKTEVTHETPIVTENIIEKAVTDEPQIIRNKLELLPDGEKLKIEAIENLRKELDEAKKKGNTHTIGAANRNLYQLLDVNVAGIATNQSIKWNGTQWVAYTPSGVNSIIAGTNITISPTNGLGNVTINSALTTPASPVDSIQVNRAGAFYGSSDLKWTQDKELIITGDASTYIATPANPLLVFEEDAAYAYDNNTKINAGFRVYAYRTISAVKYFSTTYAESVIEVSSQDGIPVRTVMTWDAVVGATGYYVVLINDAVGPSPLPFAYDYYVDVATNSLTDNFDKTYVPFTDGVDNIPIGAVNAFDNLQVRGNAKFSNLVKMLGSEGVVIDTTGAATDASTGTALDVRQGIYANDFINIGAHNHLFPFYIDKNSTGIGAATTAHYLSYLTGQYTATADNTESLYGQQIQVYGAGASARFSQLAGLVVNAVDSSAGAQSMIGAQFLMSAVGTASPSQLFGVFMTANKNAPGNASILEGADISANVGDGGTLDTMYGGNFKASSISSTNSPVITEMAGGYFQNIISGRGSHPLVSSGKFRLTLTGPSAVLTTVGDAAIIRGELTVTTVVPTVLYGIYMPAITGGTTNYAMYLLAGNSYMGGNLGLGINPTDTSRIYFNSNTTTISQMRFSTGGSLLTSPLAGAVEAISDKLHYTIATGTARKEFTLNDIALTAGRIALTTTNGRITDSSNFTYSGATMTLNTLNLTNALGRAYGGTGQTTSPIKFTYTTDVNNSGTSETDLYTSTLAAGQLGTNSDIIESQYGGIITSVATSTQQLKVYFGGTAIFDSGALNIGVSTTYWTIYATIIRVSSSVVRCSVTLTTSFASLSAYTSYTEVTGLTLANTQILKITGTAGGVGGASNQITSKEGYIEYKPIT